MDRPFAVDCQHEVIDMDPRGLWLLPALIPLFASASAAAEPADRPAVSDVTCQTVFAAERAAGPLRPALEVGSAKLNARAIPSPVLDWVSPLFVWIEPGYAFAELTLAL